MPRVAQCTPLVLLIGLLPGCQSDPYVEIIRDHRAAVDETTAILKDVKDEASMEAARPRLEKVNVRFQEIAHRKRRLLEPDEDSTRRILQEKEASQKSVNEWVGQMQRVMKLPGGQEFLKSLGSTSDLGANQ